MIRAAAGWLELGMPGDALCELEGLPPAHQQDRKVLELKLSAQMSMGTWKDASVTGLELCGVYFDEPDFFLSAAFCLHEAGDTKEAMECLLSGPMVLREHPLFHYNMACYLWTLGEGDTAREHLRNAIGMDEGFLESARADRDLVGMNL